MLHVTVLYDMILNTRDLEFCFVLFCFFLIISFDCYIFLCYHTVEKSMAGKDGMRGGGD